MSFFFHVETKKPTKPNVSKKQTKNLFTEKSLNSNSLFKTDVMNTDESLSQIHKKINIEGIDVHFPFEPYDIQISYMQSVIDSLKNKKNALLQSPTGTGKTLCLLCASLAWLKEEKLVFEKEKKAIVAPKIIYASRTHSQLKQVIKELKNTVYRPRMTILGSRDHFCNKKEFWNLKGHALNMACTKAKTRNAENFCKYYNGYKMNFENYSGGRFISEPLDIEQLRDVGETNCFCSYYFSMKIGNSVDLIFMPYNYLLEIQTLKNLDVNLNNSTIIFDEAHNIEQNSEEGSSFELSIAALEDCEKELEQLESLVTETRYTEKRGIATSQKDLLILNDSISSFKNYLKNCFTQSYIKQYSYQEKGAVFEGKYIFEFLLKATKKQQNDMFMLNNSFAKGIGLDNLKEYLIVLDKATEDMMLVTCRGLDKWKDFLNLVLSLYKNDYLNQEDGTLAPFQSFENEIKMPFEIKISNKHIINPDDCLSALIIKKGPLGTSLNFSYKNRDNDENYVDLGEAIFTIIKQIPNGVLVFFSSYFLLDKCYKIWATHSNKILKRIEDTKTETRSGDQMKSKIDLYLKESKKKGAILLAVCRGKVSEGIDFSDEYARGVILVGIPFPPVSDRRVELKKDYLDKKTS